MTGVLRRLAPVVAWVSASGLVLALPVAAIAAVAPDITSGPTIAGTPQEGATLTATATWTGSPDPTPAWKWLATAAVITVSEGWKLFKERLLKALDVVVRERFGQAVLGHAELSLTQVYAEKHGGAGRAAFTSPC